MLPSRHNLVLSEADFLSQLPEQVQRLKFVVFPWRQNLPPVQAHSVQKLASPGLQQLIYAAIAFRLSRELMNANNRDARPLAPLFIDAGSREGKT